MGQSQGFPGGPSGKEPTCQCRRHKKLRFDPWVEKILWRREWQPTPVFLPGKSHGQRSLAGYTVNRVAKSQARLSCFHSLQEPVCFKVCGVFLADWHRWEHSRLSVMMPRALSLLGVMSSATAEFLLSVYVVYLFSLFHFQFLYVLIFEFLINSR